MQIIDLLIITFLLSVFYQDYKHRAISWINFPVGFILFAYVSYQHGEISEQASFFMLNLGICLFVFISLVIYFSIKNKQYINIVDNYIGLGDLLFILILALCFSPINFILFINLSLLITLLIYGLSTLFIKSDNKNIPFAGILAVYYLIFFVLNQFLIKTDPYVDLKIFTFLYYE